MPFLTGWTKRRPLADAGYSATAAANSVFYFDVDYAADMNQDFSDLRVTTADGETLLDFWVHPRFLRPGYSCRIWIQFPTFPDDGSTAAYLYYGNAAASSASSLIDTFTWADDHTGVIGTNWSVTAGTATTFAYQTQTVVDRGISYADAPAYRGPWSTGPQWTHDKGVYVPALDKTFFCWALGPTLLKGMVQSFDHTTGELSAPTQVFATADGDAHRTPCIFYASDQKFYVGGAAHADTLRLYQSNSINSIAAFSEKTAISTALTNHTYMQIHEPTNGTLLLLYREDTTKQLAVRTYVIATNTLSAETIITDWATNQCYWVSATDPSDQDKIHVMATVYIPGDTDRIDLHYFTLTSDGSVVTDKDGNTLTAPIDLAEAKVLDTGTDEVNLHNMVVDSTGTAFGLYSVGDFDGAADGDLKVFRIESDGTATNVDTGVNVHTQFTIGCIQRLADNDLRIWIPNIETQSGEDGGDITVLQSTDGGDTWSTLTTYVSGASLVYNWICPVIGAASADGMFDVLCSYGNGSATSGEGRVMALGRTRESHLEISDYGTAIQLYKSTGADVFARENTSGGAISDHVLEADVVSRNIGGGSDQTLSMIGTRIQSGANTDGVYIQPNRSAAWHQRRRNGGAFDADSTGTAQSLDRFAEWEISVNGTTNQDGRYNDSLIDNSTHTISASGYAAALRVFNSELFIRWPRSRPYNATEPTIAAGSPEDATSGGMFFDSEVCARRALFCA